MPWTVSHSSHAFGNVDAWKTKKHGFKVVADGKTTKMTSISVTGPFSVSPSTFAKDSTGGHVDVTFHAQAAGSYTGTLTVKHGDKEVATIALSGVVVDAPGDVVVKHALLAVPDYGDTTYVNPQPGIDSTQLVSFLRLGKFDYTQEPPQARELLRLIPQVTSASDPNTPSPNTQLIPVSVDSAFPAGTIFADDIRKRAQDKGLSVADDPDHGLTLETRNNESSRLYSRGGWRDHSDGNRISTTYGDKVEVIRGNYKMIVMGRQNKPSQAMGWDTAGAHIQDYAPGTMPGASFWLEWIDDPRYHAPDLKVDDKGAYVKLPNGDVELKSPTPSQKGVWLLVNTTENVYEYARNAGNFREEVWGDVNEAYVGSENPPSGTFAINDTDGTKGHTVAATARISGRNYDFPGTGSGNKARSTPPWNKDNIGMVRSNPHIIEKTWAVRIDSYTGTSGYLIPEIHEHTFAKKTYTYTGSFDKPVEYAEEKAYVTNSFTHTMGATFHEVSHAIAQTNINTVAGTIAEFTASSTIFEATTSLVHAEAEVCVIGHIAIELSTLVFEFFAGLKLEVSASSTAEVTIDKKGFHLNADEKALVKTNAAIKENKLQISRTQTALRSTNKALVQNVQGAKVNIGI